MHSKHCVTSLLLTKEPWLDSQEGARIFDVGNLGNVGKVGSSKTVAVKLL